MSSTDPLVGIDDWPVRAAAGAATVRGDVVTRGPIEERFSWASVTKLLTTMAVLIAVEEGSVSLDQGAGPPGATLRHLLAHASGLDRDENRVVAPPGTRRLYSNRGIEVAAAVVEAATGIAWADYVTEAVLTPLGMGATRIDGSAASAASGPLTDLLALARELLLPTLIDVATLEGATTVAFPGLDGILPGFGRQHPNDWGVGFELRDHKDPHWTGATNAPATFGHFGLAGSFLWVDPVAGVVGVGLAEEDFGPWAKACWPPLADAVLARYRPTPPASPAGEARTPQGPGVQSTS